MRYLKGNYLVGVSGGPDSMALLDMCYKKKLNIIACHINYHKRKSANRDERILRDYCKKNNIKLIIKNGEYISHMKGNFQENARNERYELFKELVNKYNLEAVLVGHHYDDLLETYLLQKKHGGQFSYYGLNRKTIIKDILVIRPLLNKRKIDLIKYCDNNNIKYGIDESNYSDLYQRNIIRKQLANYSDKEKEKLLKEIKKENIIKEKIDKDTKRFINGRKRFNKKEFLNYKYNKNVFRLLIKPNISDKYLDELIKKINSSKNNKTIIDDWYIVSEYDYVEIFKRPEVLNIRIDKISYIKISDYYKLAKKGKNIEGFTINENDFPLTIRNYQDGDYINMRFGKKKINRFFIDNKISTFDRMTLPIVLNKNNEVIFVYGLGCDRDHYSIKHNIFMIKLLNMEDEDCA